MNRHSSLIINPKCNKELITLVKTTSCPAPNGISLSKSMMRTSSELIACFVLMSIGPSAFVLADDVQTEIQTILNVGKAGAGHAAGVPALKLLVGQRTNALIPI